MGKQKKEATSNRRDFLKAAGVGTLAGTAALVSAAGKPAEAAGKRADGSLGYRETDHVKTYYKLARF